MLRLTLLALALFVAGCDERSSSTSFESSRGEITYKERVRPDDGKFERGLRELSARERDFLIEHAKLADSFVSKYVAKGELGQDLLENLDKAFAAWLASEDPLKESASQVEAIVGAALGTYCAERLPVRWAVASDETGVEFVVVGEAPPSRSYPLASVRYRIEDRKTNFIGALYEALVHLRAKAT